MPLLILSWRGSCPPCPPPPGSCVLDCRCVIRYCHMDALPGLMLAVDYRNAFDSLDHDFLWFTLESFNFCASFRSWVKLLYTGAQLTVKNNGFIYIEMVSVYSWHIPRITACKRRFDVAISGRSTESLCLESPVR